MAALLVFVAVVAVYMQSLGGPFLWDDRLLILDAPLIEKGGSLGDFLNAPFWARGAFHAESTSYYRPLVSLSFALDHAVHGENSGGYHLTNLLLHATNALFVYVLVKKQGTRRETAALLAVAWALLPRLSEAAAWISGRTDLLASFFTFLALLAWGPSLTRRSVAALLVGVGLLAKEVAAAGAIAIAVGVWLSSAPEPGRKRSVRVLVELAPLVVVLFGYAVLRFATVGVKDETVSVGVLGRMQAVLEAVGTYSAMLVDVWRPRAVIGRVGATTVAGLAAGIAVLLLALALFRFRSRLDRASATGLALFAGALLPVLHLVPIPLLTLAADRFLYLPTAGLVLALAPNVDRLLGGQRVRWAGALAFVGSLGFATFQRVGVWSDELDFWVQTYLETPKTNSAAANELANVYYRAGLIGDALILSERALRYDDPHRTTASYNAGLCLARLGRYDEARAEFRALLRKGRRSSDVELQLALLEIRAGRFDQARKLLIPLARSGNMVPRMLLAKLPELEQARHELDSLDASSPAERRAPLATLVDDEVAATHAWLEVLAMPSVPKPIAANALSFLVQRGDRQALEKAASVYRARFGKIEPELDAMIGVHLAELERLTSARGLVGLVGPEKTQEITIPAR